MKSKFVILAVLALSCLVAVPSAPAKKQKPKPIDQSVLMKREETMVLNLNRGPGSTKFYLLESLRRTREMQKDLFRAMRQVEQTDANYAKARNRADDRTMNATVERLKRAQATAEKLEQELEAASTELKSDIQATLIQH
jgi:GTPase SAR1 family protein